MGVLRTSMPFRCRNFADITMGEVYIAPSGVPSLCSSPRATGRFAPSKIGRSPGYAR